MLPVYTYAALLSLNIMKTSSTSNNFLGLPLESFILFFIYLFCNLVLVHSHYKIKQPKDTSFCTGLSFFVQSMFIKNSFILETISSYLSGTVFGRILTERIQEVIKD